MAVDARPNREEQDQQHVEATVHALQRAHPDINIDDIRTWVLAEFDTFRGARVTQFLPILVIRAVEERIRDVFADSQDDPAAR